MIFQIFIVIALSVMSMAAKANGVTDCYYSCKDACTPVHLDVQEHEWYQDCLRKCDLGQCDFSSYVFCCGVYVHPKYERLKAANPEYERHNAATTTPARPTPQPASPTVPVTQPPTYPPLQLQPGETCAGVCDAACMGVDRYYEGWWPDCVRKCGLNQCDFGDHVFCCGVYVQPEAERRKAEEARKRFQARHGG